MDNFSRFNIPALKDEILKFSAIYEKKLKSRQNHLTINLLNNGSSEKT